ncbi:MAG: dihydroorotase [Coriobacteriales bacterium]|nr:dihydroorotase [Coriobacteriales bacterium]MBQ6586459.1 dihydroorotase [Coriobacteriales bacterium]
MLLLKGARLVDPQLGLDSIANLLIDGERIAAVGTDVTAPQGAQVRDMSGKVIMPGFIDVHVHLREPGQEYKETIATGSRAAVKGGFVGVAPMANTNPVCDTGSRVTFLLEREQEEAVCRIHPIGACTKGLKGETLAEIGDMVAAGAVAFSDDGRGVQDDGVMRRVMDYVKMFDKCVMSHCQREDLVGSGVVNEGVVSTRLGMAGWPAAGEEIQISRDIALSNLTRCKLHIQHITTAAGVELVQRAKAAGIPVTCEVTPHHLFLCEDDIGVDYDTNLKMNPPLRTAKDTKALQEALIRGDIDCVATDHAPHAAHEKALEFELAPFGTTGLESAVALLMDRLVNSGRMGYDRLVQVLSVNPRKVLGLEPLRLEAGAIADLSIVDPNAKLIVGEGGFESKSANSAFLGWELSGAPSDVYVGGVARMIDGKLV